MSKRISDVCGNVTENPNAMYKQQLTIRHIFRAVDGKLGRSKNHMGMHIVRLISKKDNEKDDPLPARFRRKSDAKGWEINAGRANAYNGE